MLQTLAFQTSYVGASKCFVNASQLYEVHESPEVKNKEHVLSSHNDNIKSQIRHSSTRQGRSMTTNFKK